mgnify:CR=1 FL=1
MNPVFLRIEILPEDEKLLTRCFRDYGLLEYPRHAGSDSYQKAESYLCLPAESEKWDYFSKADKPPVRCWKVEAVISNG